MYPTVNIAKLAFLSLLVKLTPSDGACQEKYRVIAVFFSLGPILTGNRLGICSDYIDLSIPDCRPPFSLCIIPLLLNRPNQKAHRSMRNWMARKTLLHHTLTLIDWLIDLLIDGKQRSVWGLKSSLLLISVFLTKEEVHGCTVAFGSFFLLCNLKHSALEDEKTGSELWRPLIMPLKKSTDVFVGVCGIWRVVACFTRLKKNNAAFAWTNKEGGGKRDIKQIFSTSCR